MGYFPLCLDLTGKKVLLVGHGPQTGDKTAKLTAFGADLIRCETVSADMLDARTAFVVVGDTPIDIAEQISRLCVSEHIPVNVVDQPSLSTFYFPAILTRGEVTVSISTGGKAPGMAGMLARRIGEYLPDDMGKIIDQLHELRQQLYTDYPKETARRLLREAMERAFEE